MTDETTDKPPEVVPPELKDFITAYTKKATYLDGVVTLAHSGDGVTINLVAPYTKIIIRHKQTERQNITTKDAMSAPWVSSTTDKKEITHEDNLYTLDATNNSKTITNDNEKTVTQTRGINTVETFYDFNHFITLDDAYDAAGKKVSVKITTPPPPSPGGKTDWTPWIIGGIAVIAALVIVWYFFLRGRAPAISPAVPAVPAPAPIVVVK